MSMDDVFAILGVIFLIIVGIFIFTLPFAFIGWAIATFASFFGADVSSFTYFTYAAGGLSTVVVIGLLRALVGR